MIQIIGGKYRSRQIQTPDEGTVPTKNRVREALMSAVGDILPGATVLDLFAGSGALGIEALSRGAKKAYFVDSRNLATKVITGNLKTLKEGNGLVFTDDFHSFLRKDGLPKFDLVFLDPPYAEGGYYQEAVSMLLERDLLSEHAAIVMEYERGISVDVSSFARYKEYTYGRTKVLIARKAL